MRTKSLLAVIVVMLLAAVTTVPAQSLKIGVFDPLRVSEETAEGQKIAAGLKAYFDKKQAELNTLQQQLVALQQQAQAALSLSETKRNELAREIQRKNLELTSARETAQRELQLEQAEAESRFEQQLLRVVDAYARQEGFDLILDRYLVVWASSSVDLTTGIVDLFDQMAASGGTEDDE